MYLYEYALAYVIYFCDVHDYYNLMNEIYIKCNNENVDVIIDITFMEPAKRTHTSLRHLYISAFVIAFLQTD